MDNTPEIGDKFITKRDGKLHTVARITFYNNNILGIVVMIYLDENGFAFTEDKIRKWIKS